MANVSRARRVILDVTIDGHDAASYLSPSLLSFEYTDQAAGKSDEIQLEMHDRDDNWLGGWLPLKGAIIMARLRCRDWHGPGHHPILNCGAFKCDEPADYQGPPNKVRVKAVSAALTSELRETAHTKGWENYSLQGLAGELAGKHGLELFYDAPPHQFQRQDQRRETDLAFLQRLATARGVGVKVHDGRLVMFEAKKGDAQGPTLTINRKNGDFFTALDYSFKISSEGTGYDGAEVEYHEPATRELRKVEFKPTGGGGGGSPLTTPKQGLGWPASAAEPLLQSWAQPGGSGGGGSPLTTPKQGLGWSASAAEPLLLEIARKGEDSKILTLDNRVESEADAQVLAQSRLRAANQKELTGSITIMGYPGLVSGITVTLEDFGIFSGKYFVEKTSHKAGDKYTTSADIRQVLDY